MALNSAAMIVGADALRAALVGAKLHTAAAGTNGTDNASAAARVAITWGAATGLGDFSLSAPLAFTGGAPNGAIYSVTLWSTSTTGGTYYGEFILSGDVTFDGSGNYTVTAIDLTGTAT